MTEKQNKFQESDLHIYKGHTVYERLQQSYATWPVGGCYFQDFQGFVFNLKLIASALKPSRSYKSRTFFIPQPVFLDEKCGFVLNNMRRGLDLLSRNASTL